MKKNIILVFLLAFITLVISANFNTTPVNISNAGKDIDCLYPKIAVDLQGGLHVVWTEFVTGINSEIFYRYYGPEGWGKKINISQNAWPSLHPDVTVDENGSVYIVWADTENRSNFRRGVVFRELDPNGNLSKTHHILPDVPKDLFFPAIACSPDGKHISVVTWQKYVVYGANRENGIWEPWKRISRDTIKWAGETANLVYANGMFHAVWPSWAPEDGRPIIFSTIYVTRKPGEPWGNHTIINPPGKKYPEANPDIFVEDDGTRHVVWMQEKEGFWSIFYDRYDPLTNEWGRGLLPYRVSQHNELCKFPSVTRTTDGKLYVAWTIGVVFKGKNAFYSVQHGDHWVQNQTFVPGGISWPTFTDIDSGGPNHNVFFVYEHRNKPTGKKDIFLVSNYPIELGSMIHPPENLSSQLISTAKLNPFNTNHYHLLSWEPNNKNDENPPASYLLYRREAGESDDDFVQIKEIPAGTFRYSDSSIAQGIEYVYGITAVDEDGNESRMITYSTAD